MLAAEQSRGEPTAEQIEAWAAEAVDVWGKAEGTGRDRIESVVRRVLALAGVVEAA